MIHLGFFCYSVNTSDNIGFLKFVIVDKTKRGKGYGKKMLNLAKQCYEKVGFVERKIDKDVFAYKDELWSRCNMIISKQSL